MAGANAKERPPRRQLIDRRDGMCCDGRKPRTRNGDTGAKPDARGVRSSQRKGGIAIRPDHLAVRRPGAVVAEIFQFLEDGPIVDLRRHHTTVLHPLAPYSSFPLPRKSKNSASLILRRPR